MTKKNPKPAKFDELQIKKGALEDLGKEIAARLEKIRGYEAAAREKAGVELQKADDHWISITQTLARVKAQCSGMGFKAFKERYCPDLGRSRVYELLAIGSGKKTVEETRLETRKRTAKSRAKVSATDASVADKPGLAVRGGNGQTLDVAGLSEKAQEQIARATGSAEVSLEQRQAENAALAEAKLTPEQISNEELASFKRYCQEHCPKMIHDDLKRAVHYLCQKDWLPIRTQNAKQQEEQR
jgi:hypothetical protein